MTAVFRAIVGYLIDPAAATIRTVEISKERFVQTVCRLIGCEATDSIRVDENHVAHYDCRGMMEPATGLWTFPARASKPPIAGRAVITGSDGKTAPTLPMHSFAAMITAFRPVIVPDAAALARLAMLDTTEKSGPTVRRVRVDGFHLEIERHPLAVRPSRHFNRNVNAAILERY